MSYRINEIFHSLQGEGARAGSANVFVRFSGCNLQCSADGPEGFDCDTEFTSGIDYSLHDLLQAIFDTAGGPNAPRAIAVILTGGEPGLQIDQDMIDSMKESDFFVAIETNGTRPMPRNIDWISCSPKTAEHTLRLETVDELRYVRNVGMGLPKPKIKARHHFLSPAAHSDGTIIPAALAHCIELCLANPNWRLSVQQHKRWRIR